MNKIYVSLKNFAVSFVPLFIVATLVFPKVVYGAYPPSYGAHGVLVPSAYNSGSGLFDTLPPDDCETVFADVGNSTSKGVSYVMVDSSGDLVDDTYDAFYGYGIYGSNESIAEHICDDFPANTSAVGYGVDFDALPNGVYYVYFWDGFSGGSTYADDNDPVAYYSFNNDNGVLTANDGSEVIDLNYISRVYSNLPANATHVSGPSVTFSGLYNNFDTYNRLVFTLHDDTDDENEDFSLTIPSTNGTGLVYSTVRELQVGHNYSYFVTMHDTEGGTPDFESTFSVNFTVVANASDPFNCADCNILQQLPFSMRNFFPFNIVSQVSTAIQEGISARTSEDLGVVTFEFLGTDMTVFTAENVDSTINGDEGGTAVTDLLSNLISMSLWLAFMILVYTQSTSAVRSIIGGNGGRI